MAGVHYTMLKRVSKFSIGAVGAAEADCMEIFSVRDAEYGVDASEVNATDSMLFDAVVDTVLTGRVGALVFTTESFAKATLAAAMHGTVSSGRVLFGSPDIATDSGQPDYFCAYIHGYDIENSPMLLHVKQMYVKPGTKTKLSKDQALLATTCVCVSKGDEPHGEEIAALDPDPVDSTPPTVSSWTPTNGASAVSKTAVTPIVLVFSEAVRSADVLAKVGVLDNASKAAIAGAGVANGWSASADCITYTFTPNAHYTAGAVIEAFVLAGVRDVAGNALAANSVITFTVAS